MHQDIEFHAEINDTDITEVFDTWQEALNYVGDKLGKIDVCIWSKEGAYAYGGDDAVDMYKIDPYASVFERWTKKQVDSYFDYEGMVP